MSNKDYNELDKLMRKEFHLNINEAEEERKEDERNGGYGRYVQKCETVGRPVGSAGHWSNKKVPISLEQKEQKRLAKQWSKERIAREKTESLIGKEKKDKNVFFLPIRTGYYLDIFNNPIK